LELVGLSEVAEMAGVSRQAVVNWRARFSDFPSPTAELASGPVWIREDIEKWLKKREGHMEGIIGRVTGSGKLETHEVSLSDFDRLELANAIHAEVTRSDKFSVTVTTDDNLFNHVDFSKSGGTLRVRLKPWISFRHISARVAISMPDLRGIKISGATRASVSGFGSANALDIAASGASRLKLDEVKAGDTKIDVSGASHVTGKLELVDCRMEASGASTVELNGRGNNIRLDFTGASTARLSEFSAVNVEVSVGGASKAEVTFSGKLDAEASGASRISYAGEGTLGKVRVTGASNLNRK